MVVGARQNFQFFIQKSWFLGNNRGLPLFRYRILYHNLLVLPIYKKISP